ncbi:kinase-like domain-containing protein [Xylariaceae sp. FL1019]|nr:kinase-like domain-containing protein [Xylariaceae sp. FL1019]
MDPQTGIILLRDRSKKERVGVSPIESCTNVQVNDRISDMVVVMEHLNETFWLEGSDKDRWAKFQIIWNGGRSQTRERARKLGSAKLEKYSKHGGDDADLSLGRFLCPKEKWPSKITHFNIKSLGSGAFGKVSETVNVHTGQIMAVKTIKRPHDPRKQQHFERSRAMAIEREIHYFKLIGHRHIVGFYGSNITNDKIEIFMHKKDGSLESLVNNWQGSTADLMATGRTALLHILSGLDYLDQNGLMHRDIKQDNVLYERRSSGYRFLLADLGGIKSEEDRRKSTFGATRFFAPEVVMGRGQTAKSDIWSTYVTMLWVWNVGGFRDRDRRNQLGDIRNIHRIAVKSTVYERGAYNIRAMAIWDPNLRPSAGEMLEKLNGTGVSHWSRWMNACQDYRNPLVQEMEVLTGFSFRSVMW